MPIDDHKLRVFCSVVDHRSFSLAAKHVHLTQAAVSTHVRELEMIFGMPLVDRSRRPVTPTETGKLLYQAGTDVLNRIRDIEMLFLDIKRGLRGEVKVSTFFVFPLPVLASFISRFHTTYPGIYLQFRSRRYHEALDNVMDSSSHFGLVTFNRPPPDLRAETVTQLNFLVVRALSKGKSNSKTRNPDSIFKEGLVIPSRDMEFVKMLQMMLRERGIDQCPIRLEVGSWEVAKLMVLGGIGMTILPQPAVANEISSGQLEPVKIRRPLKTHVYLVSKNNRYITPSMEIFRDFTLKELPHFLKNSGNPHQ